MQVSVTHREEVKSHVAETACQLLKRKLAIPTKSIRILSIGCGDGTFDIKILQTITNRFPDWKICYVGVDVDRKFCQQARELLNALKNVKVEIMILDFQQMDFSRVEIPPCDLVLAVHVLYYMRDIKKVLSDVQRLRKPDGKVYI